MCQKEGRNRPKEQSNTIYNSTCKSSIKINRLGIRRICRFVSKRKKRAKQSRKNLEKIQEYHKHRKRQQKLNISDLKSTFNASDKNCQIYFRRKAKNTIISKIKTEQHDETYDLTSFMANPAAQMLKNISKSVCGSLGGFPQRFKQFLRNFNIKILYCFCSKIQATVKACA